MRGIRVVELSVGVMGPFAGRLFVDSGADVLKVHTAHDWTRSSDDPGLMGLHMALNRGKHVVQLPATQRHDEKESLSRLLQSADVVISDGGPESLLFDRWATALNPSLIRTYVSAFGLDGPYADLKASCIQLLALGGIMYITGEVGKGPLQIPGHHPEFIAGLHAYTATAAAVLLRTRKVGGSGDRVDVSAHEAVAASAEMVTTLYSFTGAVRSRFSGRQPWGIQGEVLPCRDGFVAVHPGSMDTLSFLIGRPELSEDRLFVDAIYRLEHADEFLDLLRPYLLDRSRSEIIEECTALRIPFGAVLEIPDLLADRQLLERCFFELHEVAGRSMRLPGRLYRRTDLDGASAPDLFDIGQVGFEEIMGKWSGLGGESSSSDRKID